MCQLSNSSIEEEENVREIDFFASPVALYVSVPWVGVVGSPGAGHLLLLVYLHPCWLRVGRQTMLG